MSLTEAVNLLRSNPRESKESIEKKIGLTLPPTVWLAARHVSGASKVSPNEEDIKKTETKAMAVENHVIKNSGRKPSVPKASRNICASILEEDPEITIDEIADRLGHKPTKDSFRRAQLMVGGVKPYQKKVFNRFVELAEDLQRRGRDPHSMSVADFEEYYQDRKGSQERSVVLSSKLFQEKFPVFKKGGESLSVPKEDENISETILTMALPTDDRNKYKAVFIKKKGVLHLVVKKDK